MTYTIAQLSTLYNVTYRTLRFYEQRGLLAPIRNGTIRTYSVKDRIRLELILKAKRFGFSLSEIEILIAKASESDIESSRAKKPDITDLLDLAEVSSRIESLEARRADLDSAIEELNVNLLTA